METRWRFSTKHISETETPKRKRSAKRSKTQNMEFETRNAETGETQKRLKQEH